MSLEVGVLGTIELVTDAGERLWTRLPNGHVVCLGADDGPEVAVGDTVLISVADDTFEVAPPDLFPHEQAAGHLATVETNAPEEPLWVRYVSGAFGPLPRENGPTAQVGDVVLVTGHSFTLAPTDLVKPRRRWSGVVRRVEEDSSLVEVDGSLSWHSHVGDVDWKVWSTVELTESGVVREIAGEPMRYHDNPPAATAVHSRFRVEPGAVTETFEGIKGLDPQIAEIREIIDQLRNADDLREKGLLPVRGVLFAGESGTGKTMLARAMSNEAGATFFQVRGPEIASKWINESEEMLRALLDEADQCERAIVFFDEIDSVASARSDSSHEMSNKLITQFLTVLDGFKARRSLVIGATNRPDSLDPTLLRTGRFDKRINFGLPDEAARAAILGATRPVHATPEVDYELLARETDQWCSADLRGLWNEANQFMTSEGRTSIITSDCRVAVQRLRPNVLERRRLERSNA